MLLGGAAGLLGAAGAAGAQGMADAQPFALRPIDSVRVEIANPSGDAAFDARITDSVRRAIGLFPGAAPLGGMVMIAGWLAVALTGLIGRRGQKD